MAREWALAHARGWPPWQDGNPPAIGTYMTSCINADGFRYVACHYWHDGWHGAGPYVTVLGWLECPPAQ